MTRAVAGLFVLGLLFGAASPDLARAQQNKHWVVCGGNWFNTCASVDVTIEGLVTDTDTRSVTLRVMNLSGLADFSGTPTYAATVFTKIGFFNIGSTDTYADHPLTMAGDEIAGDSDWQTDSFGNPAEAWVLGDPNNAGGIELDLTAASGTNSSVDNAIANQCAPEDLPGGRNAFWWNDCYTDFASVNYADYTEIQFNVNGVWDLASSEMLVMGQNGPDGDSTQCITGSEGNCSVVPEPISMILLGTGLAGVGGASFMRRRREEEEEELV